jgi:hypothetical protein
VNHFSRRQLLWSSAAAGAVAITLTGCEEAISKAVDKTGLAMALKSRGLEVKAAATH